MFFQKPRPGTHARTVTSITIETSIDFSLTCSFAFVHVCICVHVCACVCILVSKLQGHTKQDIIGYAFPKQLGLDEQVRPGTQKRISCQKNSYGLIPISKFVNTGENTCTSFFIRILGVLYIRPLFFSKGFGGFRKVYEVGRNHLYLSWYLSDAVVRVIRFGGFT